VEALDRIAWRKSSFSGSNGGACVEVGQADDGTILVRDTKDCGRGPVHRYSAAEWRAFIAGARNGEFDLNEAGRLPL
jgi:Domain of unknown function (DUF397)